MNDTRKLFADGINRNIQKKFKFDRQLADALGVDKSVVSAWKTANTFPRPDMIDSIAEQLGCSPAMLFCNENEELALKLGLHIKCNPKLEHLVQLADKLTNNDLDTVMRVAELAANQK